MRPIGALSIFFTMMANALAQSPQLVGMELPRTYGYYVGDTMDISALVMLPKGWAADQDGMPTIGSGNRVFELRKIVSAPAPAICAECRRYTLQWQLFKSVRGPQTLSIPAHELRFRAGGQTAQLKIPAVEISTAPLLAWQSKKDWVDSVQPGFIAAPHEVARPLQAAFAWLLLALCASLAWAWLTGRLFVTRRRPFAYAWRATSRLLKSHDQQDALQQALRHMHLAFNQAAGQAVFLDSLAVFFAGQPWARVLEQDIRQLFVASRHHFYGLPGPVPSLREVEQLLLRLRDGEAIR